MDFQSVPSDPECFDKLSRCDLKTGQRVSAVGSNRCLTGRGPREENPAGRLRQSRASGVERGTRSRVES